MRVNVKILKILREEKISAEELGVMLDKAAITSIRGFNRRYFHWLFLMQGNVLKKMEHAQMTEIGIPYDDYDLVKEDHDLCDGKGCASCGWIGQVGRWVTDKAAPTHIPLHFTLRDLNISI